MTASSSGLSCVLAGGDDTIIARATPAGRSALAVVRISGTGVRNWARRFLPELDLERSWHAQLVNVLDDGGEQLERGIAIPYLAPRSYTGEDMIELVVHGSSVVVDGIVGQAQRSGCRQARPGEFTMRAVANGKIDLLQAEAIGDLINAQTALQARNARLQLDGMLSKQVKRLRAELMGLQASIEATLEFATQGMQTDELELHRRWQTVVKEIREMLASASLGERIRDGVKVVLLGAPNAGKSTLFNTLLRSNKAIVNPRPGTTRDLNEAQMEIAGLDITLVDTAGVIDTQDELERAGIERTRAAVGRADVVVLLWAVDSEEVGCMARTPDEVPVIKVRSKWDLEGVHQHDDEWLPVSAKDGLGIEELKRRVGEAMLHELHDLGGAVAISQRQRECLERALIELEPPRLDAYELATEQLRWAQQRLDEVIGGVTTQEMYDRIFAEFCVGK